ncbi:hypothetical protein L208DRAFT_1377565 [Tricholoma matsutake]|nr:hypothetical protein L208DRAFT_1377565 [Tricholoma matsutake 945]
MIYIPSQDPPYTNDTTVSISQNVVLDADGIQDLAMKGKKFEYHFIFILLYYLQTVIEGVILLNKLVLNCQQFRNGTISTRNLEVNLEKQATRSKVSRLQKVQKEWAVTELGMPIT